MLHFAAVCIIKAMVAPFWTDCASNSLFSCQMRPAIFQGEAGFSSWLHCYLVQVRTVFNIAIGSDSQDIQRTARNALLQMLNTILKRVTLYPLVGLQPAAV